MKLLVYTVLATPLVGAYAIFAIGIVTIYRASRVLNLAHGAMAMVPAFVAYSLAQAHVPTVVGLVVGTLAGAAMGLLIERIFIRGLRHTSLTTQTVGTVAVLSLLIALASKVWGTDPKIAPGVFPQGHVTIGNGTLLYGSIGLFVAAVVLAVAMIALFKYTDIGLAMRGAAENSRAAALMGINPNRTASIAWALGGALAGFAGILLAAVQVLDPFGLSLQVLPAFVAALIAGIENVTGAFGGAVIVGLVRGLVPAFATVPGIGIIASNAGGTELALTVLALAVMYRRGQRFSAASRSESALTTPRVSPRPRRAGPPSAFWLVLLVPLVAWVFLPNIPFSLMANANNALVYTLIGVSITVLTGWVGQISLGHAAFVGIGALFTGMLARDFGIPFPFSLVLAAAAAALAATALGAISLRVRGLYLAVSTLIFSWMADSFLFRQAWLVPAGGSSSIKNVRYGIPGGFPNFDFTDRRILYLFTLAVTALGILAAANVRSSKTGRAFFAVRGSETAAASLGVDVTRYKLLAFAFSGLLAGAAGNLIMIDKRSVAPASFAFTISLFYLSIAVVGGLTRLSGVVVSALLFAALNEAFYRIYALSGYLDLVSAGLLVAAVLVQSRGGQAGGVLRKATAPLTRLVAPLTRSIAAAGSRAGARISPVGRRAVRPLSAAVETTRDVREAGSWVGTAFWSRLGSIVGRHTRSARDADDAVEASPGGSARAGVTQRRSVRPRAMQSLRVLARVRSLLAVGAAARGRAISAVRERLPEPLRRFLPAKPPAMVLEPAAHAPSAQPGSARTDAPVLIEGRRITVRFGGLVAVDDASIQIRKGEIVGLIGPNGAGKTTLFNALSGLNEPTSGTVYLFDEDISQLPVHERARRGMARTFQILQLFGGLTVRENLLVATHVHNSTGVMRHVLATDAAVRAERNSQKRVQEVIDTLDLREVADRPVAGIPFGVLRIVELARAIVTEAPIILLDEPASGLDNTETERFTKFLRTLRETYGVTMLLIEHDVRMVTGVSDFIYVLAQGRIISEGSAAWIQRDPAVISAYLGESTTEQQELAEAGAR